jgi:adenylate cyclase
MARLLVYHPSRPYQEYKLGAFNTLGRHPKQEIQIHDRVVSKEHALITLAEDRYWIQDIGSRNGTFVNGEKIRGRTILNDNDSIRLGETKITFVNESSKSNRSHESILFQNDLDEKNVSAIRSRIIEPKINHNFRPERDIRDESILREDYEKLRAVFELHEAAGDELDLHALLDRILDKIFELVNAARGVILLVNDDGKLEPKAHRQITNSREEDFRLSQTILQEVQENHTAILSDDARLDSRFEESHSIVMQGIRSIMCVPLKYNAEFLGVIYLDTQLATGVFTEKDLKIIAVFASQASAKITNAHLAHKAEEEKMARHQLSRLLSPNLVEEVVKGHINMNPGGTLMEATVMFADIRGFTRLSEQIEPKELISMLNAYFEIMVGIIFEHEGTLDKFIGDEIMAVWGAPIAQPDHGLRAIRAAHDIREALDSFNRFRVANGDIPLKIGVGINSGKMVAGYLGSSKTLSYTVLGDAVNIASRLCSHAKPDEILISKPLYEQAIEEFSIEVREPTQFKGKSTALEIFQIAKRLSNSGSMIPQKQISTIPEHDL